MRKVNVLIPTCERPDALAVTLTALCYQSFDDFDIVIADQSSTSGMQGRAASTLQAVLRLLELRGHRVSWLSNHPPRGMAQQRQFLLDACDAPLCLFLDDDVLLEPFVLRNLVRVLDQEQCGFAGNALIGLSFIDDVRPHEQLLEFWKHGVRPERIEPGTAEWHRHVLHNAANILHVQRSLKLDPDRPRAYKVAWVGGCVLFDTDKLRRAGGFGFWRKLPSQHCGEDVLAQLRVAQRFGGCGVLPSGAYHQELPTTVTERNINAPEYLQV